MSPYIHTYTTWVLLEEKDANVHLSEISVLTNHNQTTNIGIQTISVYEQCNFNVKENTNGYGYLLQFNAYSIKTNFVS